MGKQSVSEGLKGREFVEVVERCRGGVFAQHQFITVFIP